MRSAALIAVVALAACGHEEKNLSGTNQTAPPGQPGAPAPANPHAGNPSGLNPHGPLGQLPPDAVPAGAPPVAWTIPSGWKETPRSSSMRVAQFDVGADAAGDPVQCIVFGGEMGGVDDNVKRWVGQMGPAAKDAAKVTSTEHDGLKVTRLEAEGAYTDTMRPGEPKTVATAKMLAAIVEAPGGKLYVKLAGPKTVVDAAAANFDAFLASMKAK